MATVSLLRRCCSKATETRSKGTWWGRLLSRAGIWCKSLLRDYKEACSDVLVAAYEHPFKASTYVVLLGGVYTCCCSNPDNISLQTRIIETSNKLSLLSPWIRSGTSDGHVQILAKLHNEGRLHHISLGIASLAYVADYDPECSLYEARCSAFFLRWAQLPKCVLDIGFMGRWWVLEYKMKDYDINEEEFKHLPHILLATWPPTAHKTELNEKLHNESWKPLRTVKEMDIVKKER